MYIMTSVSLDIFYILEKALLQVLCMVFEYLHAKARVSRINNKAEKWYSVVNDGRRNDGRTEGHIAFLC